MKISMLAAVAVSVPAILLSAEYAGAAGMKGMDTPTAPASSPADKAFAASMNTMMKNMSVKPTGKPDKDFDDDAASSRRD